MDNPVKYLFPLVLWNFFLNMINLSYQLVIPPVSSCMHAYAC